MFSLRAGRAAAVRHVLGSHPLLPLDGVPHFPHAESSTSRFRFGSSAARAADAEHDSPTIGEETHPTGSSSSSSSPSHARKPSGNEEQSNARRLPRTKKALARERAQVFAEALRQRTLQPSPLDNPLSTDPSPPPPIVETPAAVEESVESVTAPPTLEDLEAFRPAEVIDPWSPRYASHYNRALTSIMKAFTTQQLRKLAVKDLGLEVKRHVKKNIAGKVLESWGWARPGPKPTREPTGALVFDLPQKELFLFLSDTRMLRSLMIKSRIEFSVVHEPVRGEKGKTIAKLQARADKGIIDRLSVTLEKRRAAMKSEIIAIGAMRGFEPPMGLLHVVSSVARTYIERLANGKYEISGMSRSAIELAKNLLINAALRSSQLPSTRSMLAAPSSAVIADKSSYSLSPFLPTSSNQLPWFHAPPASAATPLFRVQAPSPWSPPNRTLLETQQRDEQIEGAALERLLGVVRGTEDGNLSEIVRDVAGELQGGISASRQVVATFGHYLFPASSSDPIAALSPPVPGRWPLVELRRHLLQAASSRPIFAPTLAPSMTYFHPDSPPTKHRRLTYRLLSAHHPTPHTLVFTYTFPAAPPPQEEDDSISGWTREGIVGEGGEVKGMEGTSWVEQLGAFMDRHKAEAEVPSNLEPTAEEEAAPVTDRHAAPPIPESFSQDQPVVEEVTSTSESLSEGNGPDSEEAPMSDPDAEEPLEAHAPPPEHTSAQENLGLGSAQVDRLVAGLATPTDQIPEGTEGMEAAGTEPGADLEEQKSGRPEVGIVSEMRHVQDLDILLPNRPVDVRLTMSTSQSLPVRTPPAIKDLFQRLAASHASAIEASAEEEDARDKTSREDEEDKYLRERVPRKLSLRNGKERYELESDEEVEIFESRARFNVPPSGETSEQEGGEVVLRTVQLTDCWVAGRGQGLSTFTEIEGTGATVPEGFWRELAKVSRDVTPDAPSVRAEKEERSFLL